MRFDTEVLVVGGGPGGLWAAARLAESGIRVTVCEEHPDIGEPVHCTGILAAESFDEFDLPSEARLNDIHAVTFWSPGGLDVRYTPPAPIATIVDRGRFDRALAARAAASGATLATGARVADLAIGSDGVRARVGDRNLSARLVVLACGARYLFHRTFGLGLPSLFVQTAQREFRAARLHDVEVHFGHGLAADGFAWAVPVDRGGVPFVRIGAMASANIGRAFATMVDRVARRWGLEATDCRPRHKILPLGTVGRTYGDRLLAIGDAAGMVKPTTGGGIYYSIASAAMAADVAAAALGNDRLDAASLAEYERRWRAAFGDEFDAQRELREVASRLSDTEVDALFELARTDGIMPIVRSTAKFNHHRTLIRALFKHPPARRLLFRSMVG